MEPLFCMFDAQLAEHGEEISHTTVCQKLQIPIDVAKKLLYSYSESRGDKVSVNYAVFTRDDSKTVRCHIFNSKSKLKEYMANANADTCSAYVQSVKWAANTAHSQTLWQKTLKAAKELLDNARKHNVLFIPPFAKCRAASPAQVRVFVEPIASTNSTPAPSTSKPTPSSDVSSLKTKTSPSSSNKITPLTTPTTTLKSSEPPTSQKSSNKPPMSSSKCTDTSLSKDTHTHTNTDTHSTSTPHTHTDNDAEKNKTTQSRIDTSKIKRKRSLQKSESNISEQSHKNEKICDSAKKPKTSKKRKIKGEEQEKEEEMQIVFDEDVGETDENEPEISNNTTLLTEVKTYKKKEKVIKEKTYTDDKYLVVEDVEEVKEIEVPIPARPPPSKTSESVKISPATSSKQTNLRSFFKK